MAGDITSFDVEAMGTLAHRLELIRLLLEQQDRSGIDLSGLRNSDLRGAVEHFTKKCDYGRDLLIENLGVAASVLRQAVTQYKAADDNVAQAVGPATSGTA